ncbi:YqaJ viral recombinase family protein [Terribium terrae]|uniref:YqaJ viral recombinase family nuclease n=1 Tax=Terribium terrae TaxID=2725666 RepID=UPI00142EC759|nr:YqaJ viral recombinase family protein [Mesorhizobium terrae]
MSVEVFYPKSRDEWLALRQLDLTASDIGAVAGVDHFKSPLRVYAEKTGMIGGEAENDAMRRGRWLEAAVIEAMRETYPTWDLRRAGVYLRDTEIRMGATPDAVAEDPAEPGIINIQCKVIARPVYEREWENDKAPLKYALQTISEGVLLNSRTNLVAALVIDTYTAQLVVDEVPRHPDAENKVRTIVQQFWSNVAAGRQPAVDYACDAEVIAAMYPASVPAKIIDLSTDNFLPALLAERADIKVREKADKERVEEIDTEIKSKMGDAEEATLPGWKLTWKTQQRKQYTVAASTQRPLRVADHR